jgi:Flp pilus assembly protein TadG
MTRATTLRRSGTRASATRCLGDGGSSDALGLALIAPAAIGLALVILFLGRSVDSRATVQVAAETGAQAAAQERTPAAAQHAAQAAALAMLNDPNTCSQPNVVVDLSKFGPGGEVSVTVSCSVSSAGLELINPPDLGASTATAFATIDPLRATEGAP